MLTLILSTRNAHKIAEIRSMLPSGTRLLTLSDFPGAPSVAEDRDTFAGNAAKKAIELACWISMSSRRSDSGSRAGVPSDSSTWVMADDSGLEVDALGGAPGVHSARFAALDSDLAGNSSDVANNAKLLRLLERVPEAQRTARFRCVIALTPVLPAAGNGSTVRTPGEAGERVEFFTGTCGGRIQNAPSGVAGFGYDPLFIPDGFRQSFAELGEESKNRISHRGRAMVAAREALARISQGGGAEPLHNFIPASGEQRR